MRHLILLIILFCHSSVFAQTKTTASKQYHFKAKLIEKVPYNARCGVVSFGIAQVFEVTNTDFPKYKGKRVLIAQLCPETLGMDFFKQNAVYNLIVEDIAKHEANYFMNFDKHTKYPTFWCIEITSQK